MARKQSGQPPWRQRQRGQPSGANLGLRADFLVQTWLQNDADGLLVLQILSGANPINFNIQVDRIILDGEELDDFQPTIATGGRLSLRVDSLAYGEHSISVDVTDRSGPKRISGPSINVEERKAIEVAGFRSWQDEQDLMFSLCLLDQQKNPTEGQIQIYLNMPYGVYDGEGKLIYGGDKLTAKIPVPAQVTTYMIALNTPAKGLISLPSNPAVNIEIEAKRYEPPKLGMPTKIVHNFIPGNGFLVASLKLQDDGNNSYEGTIRIKTLTNVSIYEHGDKGRGNLLAGKVTGFSLDVPEVGRDIEIVSEEDVDVCTGRFLLGDNIEREFNIKREKKEMLVGTSIKFFHGPVYDEANDVWYLGIQLRDQHDKPIEGKPTLVCNGLEETRDNARYSDPASILGTGSQQEITIPASGYVLRLKVAAQKTDLTVNLPTGFSKTFELKKPEQKPQPVAAKIAEPIKWRHSSADPNIILVPITLLTQDDKPIAGEVVVSGTKNIKIGVNDVANLEDVNGAGTKEKAIPVEGAELAVKFEGFACDLFLKLAGGTKTYTVELFRKQ